MGHISCKDRWHKMAYCDPALQINNHFRVVFVKIIFNSSFSPYAHYTLLQYLQTSTDTLYNITTLATFRNWRSTATITTKYQEKKLTFVGWKYTSGSLQNLSSGFESWMERLLGSNRAPSRNKPNTTTPSFGGDGPCNHIEGNMYDDDDDEILGLVQNLRSIYLEWRSS